MSQMKRNIAKIKMAQKQLGMDDESYRALLKRVTGKDSATALTVMQQNQILNEMERLGWKPKRIASQYKKPASRKLVMTWRDLYQAGHISNKSNAALCAWLKKQAGKPNPDWLTPDEANACIEKLKGWLKRPAPPTN